MKILICTLSFPSVNLNHFDGKFILSEALAYAENGATVTVLTPYYIGAEEREKLQDKIEIVRFHYFYPRTWQVLKKPGVPIYNRRSFFSLLQFPFLCLTLAFSILKYGLGVDIIHAQWTGTALLALPAKWFLNKRIVLTARGSDIRLLPKWLNRLIHRKVSAAIDCFGPSNHEYRKTYPSNYITLPQIVGQDRTRTLPEEISKILSQRPGVFIILYVGRFDYIKIANGLPLLTLIGAGALLERKGHDYHIFYIGDGECRIKRMMQGLIRENNLERNVTILGPKINVLEYMKFCHLGAGGAAFNAVSGEFTITGVPQILVKAEHNFGTPWVDRVNAILVQPDDPIDLAEKIAWGIENPEILKQIGSNAKRDMEKYLVDSKLGGEIYLHEFSKLINHSRLES